MDFTKAQAEFKADRINQLANDADGLRFLKLRSMSRRAHLEMLLTKAGISFAGIPSRQLLKKAFDSRQLTIDQIDNFIHEANKRESAARIENEDDLVNELYKLQVFDWGGLHQNSLEKTIVDNYVKRIRQFDTLCDKIENELHNSMRGYVLCSWYNHWTSIVIEDIFRDHSKVLPAIGQIKKIDFFIENVPFDLKVTYMPEGYLASARRDSKLRSEIALLKSSARKLKIPIDSALPAGRCLEDLWSKHKDHPDKSAKELIKELHAFRQKVIQETQNNPTSLLVWLYENQGVRRFDASNRLFLVLVNTDNFFESWKLKRAKPLLTQRIGAYLNSIKTGPGQQITFQWDGSKHNVIADVAFVVHP